MKYKRIKKYNKIRNFLTAPYYDCLNKIKKFVQGSPPEKVIDPLESFVKSCTNTDKVGGMK